MSYALGESCFFHSSSDFTTFFSVIFFSRSLCAAGSVTISVTSFCIASPVVGSMSNFSRVASAMKAGS